jgi:MFS family permease
MRRNAALFVVISLLSGFGSTMMGLAASIWIFDLTGSVGLAALIGVCTYGPSLAAPWLGALVDRLPRRPLLIWSDLILGGLFLTLLTIDSAAGVWLIFAVLLIRGVSYIVLDAGESALLPAALPPSLLGDVNGWRTSAQEGMKLLAPLAGAGLYAWRGPTPVILIGAAMPLLSAAGYALIRLRGPAPAFAGVEVPASVGATAFAGSDARTSAETDEPMSTEPEEQASPAASEERGIRPGVRLLLSEPAVRVPVLVAAVAITLSGVTTAAVLARIVYDLQLSAAHLGLLTSAQGAGSIVGGLIVGRLLARWSPTVIAGVGIVMFAGGVLTWCLPWWPAMIAGSVVVGLGLPWTLIAAVTAVQTKTPDHLLGRVAATSNMLMFGPIALAIPLGSAVVALGARPPLLAVALLALLTAAAVLRAKTSAIRIRR